MIRGRLGHALSFHQLAPAPSITPPPVIDTLLASVALTSDCRPGFSELRLLWIIVMIAEALPACALRNFPD